MRLFVFLANVACDSLEVLHAQPTMFIARFCDPKTATGNFLQATTASIINIVPLYAPQSCKHISKYMYMRMLYVDLLHA